MATKPVVSPDDRNDAPAPENSSVKPVASPPVAPRAKAIPEVRPTESYGVQRWLTVAVAARYCSLNPKAIRTAIKKGAIPRRKIGKAFIIDARALDEWLEEGEKVRQ